MALLFYPLGYLLLRDESKKMMAWRDAPAVLLLSLLLFIPYVLIPDANFFGPSGFSANMMNLSSALAGFYVAALVAAATLARGSDLDDKIEVGMIMRGEDRLSRREYICALFGYLSYLAFALSIGLNFATSIGSSAALSKLLSVEIWRDSGVSYQVVVSVLAKIIIIVPVCHLFVVTAYGLYYLITRLYQQKPKLVAKDPRSDRAA